MPRVDQLKAMLAKEPDDLFLNFSLAMELAKTEQHEACLAQFARVLELNPDYVAAHFHKGKTLLKMRRMEEAKAALQEGIAAAGRCGDHHAESQMKQLLEAM
ncbi:MAG TPA: tetratricopeptide repeat protein [Phycisphaerae bacterium]|nr:tetratricopeptide repeat protein [Phycisphaerae bacterium]